MKILLSLLISLSLVSCSTVSQKEPWSVGDCVEWKQRTVYVKVLKVNNYEENGEYFYTLEELKEYQPDKALVRVDCGSIPRDAK